VAPEKADAPAELAAIKAERDRALQRLTLQEKQLEFLAGRILTPVPATLTGAERFNGVWVLAEPKASPAASALTPQSADLILAEDQGKIQGRYQARYPTIGRPEPTVVRFYFEGVCQQEDVANVTWNGDGAAKGEVQLRLVSDDSLELVWSATEKSDLTWPATGTVTLARKR
jgi:hypothetical protein